MTTNTDTTAASGAATRTPTDYALEFAEYLARGAEHLIEAVCADAQVRLGIAESDDVDDAAEHDAQASVDEALRSLRDRIGQFRSRLDRAARAALAAPAAQEAEPSVPVEPTDEMYDAAYEVELPTGDEDGGSIRLNTSQTRQIWQAMRAALYAHPPRPQADAGTPTAVPEGWRLVPVEFMRGFSTLAHNYSLRAVPPIYYSGTEGDAFSNAYRRCGEDLAKLRAMLAAVPQAPAAPTAPPNSWRDEVQRLSQFATTAMHMSERDKRNCLDDIAQRLANMLHEDAAPAPAAGAAPTDAEIDAVTKAELGEMRGFPLEQQRRVVRAVLARQGAAAPAQEADGWMPIETAPEGERVLLGPRHAPVVGTVHLPEPWHEEQEPTATIVHYNGNVLVAGYRCSEWRRLPGAVNAREAEDAARRAQAAQDVLAERQRQISEIGYAPDHDDEHADGSLARAAACYALGRQSVRALEWSPDVILWPWENWAWKNGEPRRMLVKAGALILAEIERLDRAAARARQKEGAA